MVGKEQGQIENNAHYRGCNRTKWRGELKVAMRGFYEWTTHKDEYKAR